MKKIAFILGCISVVLIMTVLFDQRVSAASLPDVVFLGKGPGTFTTPLDNFIIKVVPFDFDWEPGPTFEAKDGQRVWGVRGANEKPPKLWHEEVNLGAAEAGCIAKYVGIDDDVDDRINYFLLDGEIIETVTEGMVFSGSFVIPRDGDLVFVANDSVAGWFDRCSEQVEPTPTPTATATSTPEPTSTATPGPSPTVSSTPEPTDTATPGPSPTATSTAIPPTATEKPTLEPTATATKRPREHSCVRINFEVSGDEARRGLYVVQEIGGRVLASWYAEEGWMDSGWFKEIDIPYENVYVQVLYYSGPGADPVVLEIVNHAPDSPHGWMSWGMCHALEVAWPDDADLTAVSAPAPSAETQTSVPVEQAAEVVQQMVEEDNETGFSLSGASLSD
jgi:hypothetical protein